MNNDDVNHPPHYNNGKIEVFDYIKDCLTEDELRGYIKGNIIKYVSRERYKGKVEDLRKAEWYLKRYLQHHQESANTVEHYGLQSIKPTDQSTMGALTPYGREKIYGELNSASMINIEENIGPIQDERKLNQDITTIQKKCQTPPTTHANHKCQCTAG